MKSIYNANNLPFFDQKEIRLRRNFQDHFAIEVERALRDRNSAWRSEQIEAPCLIPADMISPEYDRDKMFMVESNDASLRLDFIEWSAKASASDIEALRSSASLPVDDRLSRLIEEDAEFPRFDYSDWLAAWAKSRNIVRQSLALRPETTPASYAWLASAIKDNSVRLPFCVWQANKSFRREQNQSSKHVRLLEFTQQEFQCSFAESTADDYQAYLAPKVQAMIEEMIHCPTRLVESDRLPKYSRRTLDVEAWNSEKWMEICSISLRDDFPISYRPKPTKEEKVLVLEVAIGLDRCVYCFNLQAQARATAPADDSQANAPEASPRKAAARKP